MLDRTTAIPIEFPRDAPPQLLVVIDTEEEFDWTEPLARANTAVRTIAAQPKAQAVFDRLGVTPTYVIDYPVASDPYAVELLGGWRAAGRCEIGAHLHPWVNPPHEEAVTARNSYPGNLPPALERAKLEVLTETIERNFGFRPTVYKAGRYGVGPATGQILEGLGYDVDVSIVPHSEFTGDGGPDFRTFDPTLFWFGHERPLLEIPLTCGFSGLLARGGARLYPYLAGAAGLALHAPGIAGRLRVLDRTRLTPEGAGFSDLRRVTEALLAQGQRVFMMTYHSPTLEAGHTPYTRTEAEIEDFVGTIERYLEDFLGRLGGRPSTPTAVWRALADTAPDRISGRRRAAVCAPI